MSKKEDTLEHISLAIENGWKLRPVGKVGFINKEYAEGTTLDDHNQILDDIEDLELFPPGIKCVALIGAHHEDFVCLDFDFKDEELSQIIWDVFSQYRKEDLFLRKGHPDKLGQFWFRSYDKINYGSYPKFDVITTQKRCDAIGQYKVVDNNDIEYKWPYRNPWDYTPEDLPIINKELINNIIEKVCGYFGEDVKNKGLASSSRHDQLVKIATDGVSANRKADDILYDMFSSEAYKSLQQETKRNASQEVANAFSWAMKNKAKEFVAWKRKEDQGVQGLDIYEVPKIPPKVEKFSFFDIVFKAIRRNQVIDNKKMAYITTLAICSWVTSLSVRFRGMASNLFLLLIAPSGSGKTTTSRAIQEIIKLDKRLQKSYAGQDIRTDSAVFSSVQESPILFYHIDEATKLIKTSKSKGSYNSNIGEILSQLYSDFRDNDAPLVLARTKNESYGVAIGAKATMLMSSTERFWDIFDEENYTQGLGRRLFIVTTSEVPLQKKNQEYHEDFFTREEKIAIKMFLRGYLGNGDLFEDHDISQYEILKNVETENGIKRTHHYKTCKKPKGLFNLTADQETSEYLANDFVDENNNFKIKAAGSGSNIQQYVANSRSEFILKLSMIHAVCGKKLIATGDRPTELTAAINTVIDKKSIEYGTKTFSYYMVGSTLEKIDSLYNKDIDIDLSNKYIDELLEKLEEKEISEFKKSHDEIKYFFKNRGKTKTRDKILKEMKARNLIEIEGDLDSYGCKIKVV